MDVIDIVSSDEETEVGDASSLTAEPDLKLSKPNISKAEVIEIVDDEEGSKASLANSKSVEEIKETQTETSKTNGVEDKQEPKSAEDKQEAKSAEELQNGNSMDATECEPPSTLESDSKNDLENKKKLEEFIELCKSTMKGDLKETFDSKIKLFWNQFEQAKSFRSSKEFAKLTSKATECIQNESRNAIEQFRDLFNALKMNRDCDEAETQRKVNKLDRLYNSICKKIKKLEEKEVNFDDEENSSYLVLQKYRQRAVQVFEKRCKYTKMDPHFSNAYYGRLDYAGSDYQQINIALNKFYRDRNKRPFPVYDDVDKCIRKCVTKNNLKLSDSEIKFEVKRNCEALGKVLQKRRKHYLTEVHFSYLQDLHTDPAENNQELKDQFAGNKRKGDEAMQAVINKYAKMQEEGTTATNNDSDKNSERSDTDDSKSDA